MLSITINYATHGVKFWGVQISGVVIQLMTGVCMSGGSLAVLLCVDQAASAAVAEQWERAIAEAWLHKPHGQRQNDAAATVAQLE
eukprot:COSAG01_NODE_30173_length_621_cov_1.118774_2_plen_84_part_01